MAFFMVIKSETQNTKLHTPAANDWPQ